MGNISLLESLGPQLAKAHHAMDNWAAINDKWRTFLRRDCFPNCSHFVLCPVIPKIACDFQTDILSGGIYHRMGPLRPASGKLMEEKGL